jgi:hypothetical protein
MTEFREQDLTGGVLESLTDEQLAGEVTRTEPGWPRFENFPVKGMSPNRPQRGMGTPALCRT